MNLLKFILKKFRLKKIMRISKNKFVIFNPDTKMFSYDDGNSTHDLLEASMWDSRQEVENELSKFDSPEFVI